MLNNRLNFRCLILEREDGRERERERNRFVVPLTCSLVDSCTCPEQGIKPTTLVHRGDVLTNQATRPGQVLILAVGQRAPRLMQTNLYTVRIIQGSWHLSGNKCRERIPLVGDVLMEGGGACEE